jgi:hypothetical protein
MTELLTVLSEAKILYRVAAVLFLFIAVGAIIRKLFQRLDTIIFQLVEIIKIIKKLENIEENTRKTK